MLPRRRRSTCLYCDRLDERCMLSGYTPLQITSAYGLGAITLNSLSGTTVTGNGAGQTIALIETYHDPNIQASLNTFDSEYGLPYLALKVIDQAGSQTDDGWAQEEALDVEWAHAIAPVRNIVVVEAAPGDNNAQNQNLTSLMTAVQTAAKWPGVTVVSMSWGMEEFANESSYDSNFTTPGITFIASSGDDGSVYWPASSPDVLAVGGTTLSASSAGAYQSESGWSATGGGLSRDELEAVYQDSVQLTGFRTTPDVSFDADPSSGVSIYNIPPDSSSGQGTWTAIGGTSVGAPAWAGIIAIVDQGRAITGLAPLTGATQLLPALYAVPLSAYHYVSVTTAGSQGSNLAIITTNYNTQSGLGSPVGCCSYSRYWIRPVTNPHTFPDSHSAAPGPTPVSTPIPPVPTPTPTPSPVVTPGRRNRPDRAGRPKKTKHRAKVHVHAQRHSRLPHAQRRVKANARTEWRE